MKLHNSTPGGQWGNTPLLPWSTNLSQSDPKEGLPSSPRGDASGSGIPTTPEPHTATLAHKLLH